jgi:hypothetical protein
MVIFLNGIRNFGFNVFVWGDEGNSSLTLEGD